MLKQRILTAIILIPIFLLLLFFLPSMWFLVLTGAFTLGAAAEWSHLMGLQSRKSRFAYLGVMVILGVTALFLPAMAVIGVGCLWWLFAFSLLIAYPVFRFWQRPLWRGIMGVLVLIPCWIAINYIRNQSQGLPALLFLFALIWGADSVAYFVGKASGKHKLAPLISPGKSIEGAVAALIYSVILACLVLYFARINRVSTFWITNIALALLTVIFSIVGDLFESMLKRAVNIKDSGAILPGHGGLLDRIDSLTAAAPIFAFVAWLFSQMNF